MLRVVNRALTISLATIASLGVAVASDARSNANPDHATNLAIATTGVSTTTTELQPFTYTAHIPAGADLSSITFERLQAVKVATVRVESIDHRYCEGSLQEPGGSLYCPQVRDESPTPAYRVTCSFSAPSMSSEEYPSARFTFSVDLRPEELSPGIRQAISEHKMSRQAARGSSHSPRLAGPSNGERSTLPIRSSATART